MKNKPGIKEYLDLFITFAKIGSITFGGGYAMLPILQREIVEKKKWSTDEELMDYYAIGQCTPGVIAVNTATFIGRKVKGITGGIIATIGVIFPSVVIITIIAAFISNFAHLEIVQNAFSGIRVCVCALIINAIIKLWKSAIKDILTLLIFLITFFGLTFLSLSPVIYVVVFGFTGFIYRMFIKKELKEDHGIGGKSK